MAAISFFAESITFSLEKPRKTSAWIKSAILKERYKLVSIDYIFCSDEFLLGINEQFLHHKSLTDIITFDYSESKKEVKGEIYISIPRVRENAHKFKTSFDNELHRVIIHGVLHLTGYRDKKPKEKLVMRKKEEAYLSLR